MQTAPPILVLSLAAFSACGQAGTGDAGASAARPAQYDLDAPLSADDIALYLTVMNETATLEQIVRQPHYDH